LQRSHPDLVLERHPAEASIEKRIRGLRAKGMGILKIGKTLGVGTSVVQRVLAAEEQL
jgi:hypothetical protein